MLKLPSRYLFVVQDQTFFQCSRFKVHEVSPGDFLIISRQRWSHNFSFEPWLNSLYPCLIFQCGRVRFLAIEWIRCRHVALRGSRPDDAWMGPARGLHDKDNLRRAALNVIGTHQLLRLDLKLDNMKDWRTAILIPSNNLGAFDRNPILREGVLLVVPRGRARNNNC